MVGTLGIQYMADVIHLNQTTYETRPQTPAQHLDAARRLLAAGAPASARTEVERAIAGDLRTTEVGYVRALSILSGHAFDHLTRLDVDALGQCFALARRAPDRNHGAALLVIDALLTCHADQQGGRGLDSHRLDAALAAYGELPPQRAEELLRHLGTVLGGAVQERLNARRRAEIRRHRMGGDRRARVPLFFEPDPVPPVLLAPRRSVTGKGHAQRAALGVAAMVLALALLSPALVTNPLLLVGVLAAGGGLVGSGPGVVYALRRRVAMSALQSWAAAASAAPPQDAVAAELREMILRAYSAVVPPEFVVPFLGATVEERVRLEYDLLHAYGPKPGGAGGLAWLVRWHAGRADAAWRSGATRPGAPAPSARSVLAAASAAVLALCLLVALVFQLDDSPLVALLALLALVGAGVLLPSAATWHFERQWLGEQEAELRARMAGEVMAYEAELRRLAPRPSDEEMARWLDYDKDHLRLSAMQRYGLKDDQVVAHVLITEPAEGCRRARAVNGPTRCSAYAVRLFLLTRNGVRQLDVRLDFANGAENGESRTAFRYEAIASAKIKEPSVHVYGRRQVATPEGGGPDDRLTRPILRQALELTLVSGTPITVENDFIRTLPDEHRENREALVSLAMDTSGAVGAFRTLESVAAEGRDWLALEGDRARFHSTEYLERMAAVDHRAATR